MAEDFLDYLAQILEDVKLVLHGGDRFRYSSDENENVVTDIRNQMKKKLKWHMSGWITENYDLTPFTVFVWGHIF